MSSDLIDALFQKAAESYESARRWHLLLILILLAFQAMLLVPYVGDVKQEAATKADIGKSAALRGAIGDVIADLNAFEKASVNAADAKLNATLEQLVAQFRALNGVLEKLQQMTPEEAVGPLGEAPFCRPIQTPIQMQTAQLPLPSQTAVQDQPGATGCFQVSPMSSELRRQLVAATVAKNRDALLTAIAPYVETTIIQPTFAQFEGEWREQVQTQIQVAWQTADARLTQAKADLPERAEAWSAVEAALGSALQSAKSLTLSEPPDRFWWATRMGKDATIRGALADVERARGLAELPALASLRTETAAAISAEQTKFAELQASIDALREQFKEQEAELASIAAPLKVVAIDLDRVAAWFPLLLGLVLGCSWSWMAERGREFQRSLSLYADGAEKLVLAKWVTSKIGRASPTTLTLRGGAFLVWIAIAAFETADLPGVGVLHAASGAATGAAAVIVAAGLHWRTTAMSI